MRVLAALLALCLAFGARAEPRTSAGANAAAWAMAGPQFDYNFLSTAWPVAMTFSRSTTATDLIYTSTTTSYNTYAINAPRFSATNGVLVEEARTNYLLNSASPATQTTGTLATGSQSAAYYTLWMIGTGSATVSAGTAVINAGGSATQGAPFVFQVTTAGTVIVTVSGTVGVFQLEQGPGPTSFIPTTSSTGTRGLDYPIFRGTNSVANPYGGSYAEKLILLSGGNGNSDNHIACPTTGQTPWGYYNYYNHNPSPAVTDGGSTITTPQNMNYAVVIQQASTWGHRGLSLTFNGYPTNFASGYVAQAGYQTWPHSCSLLNENALQETGAGYVQRIRAWNYQISPEMVQELSNGR